MAIKVLSVLLVLSIVLPIGAFYLGERKAGRFKRLLAINIISFFGILLFMTAFIFSGVAWAASTTAAVSPGAAPAFSAQGVGFISAALVTSVATVATGMAVGKSASAAIGALSENENIMGKALIFVALCEGIAIYGVLIAVMILGRLG